MLTTFTFIYVLREDNVSKNGRIWKNWLVEAADGGTVSGQSHGDIHHRHVAHNVIIKSLCTKGFCYLKKWLVSHKEGLSKAQRKISSKKGQINENPFEINLLSNTTEHENI